MLGAKAKDRITGFTGIVTGHSQFLTGCDRFLVCPPAKDGDAFVEGEWFDEQRLEVDPTFPPIVLDNSRGNGADKDAPKR